MKNGLPKEDKEELLLMYSRKGLLEAPILNPEVSTINNSVQARDTFFFEYQNCIGSAMASLDSTISALITNQDMEMVEFLKRLSHTGQLLVDVHHSLSKVRRAFIVPNVDKDIKTLLENSETN